MKQTDAQATAQSTPAAQPAPQRGAGLNLDDLLAAQQTAIKAVSELRRCIAELDAAKATIKSLREKQAPAF